MGHSALNKVLVLAFVLALVLQSGKRVANTSWEIGISLAHILFCIFKVSTNHKTSAAEREKKSRALERNLLFKSGWTSVKTQLNICHCCICRTYLQNHICSELNLTWQMLCLPPDMHILRSVYLSPVGSRNGSCKHGMLPTLQPSLPGVTAESLHLPRLCLAAWIPLHCHGCVWLFFKIFIQKWGFTAALG